MTGGRRLAGFYFVTDAALSRAGNASDVRSAVAAGAAAVQYRAKASGTREMYREAAALRALCRETLFIVNDRVDLALAVGADGVHVGQDDLPCGAARRLLGEAGIVGVSVRSAAEAREAERDGADYVAVSPVFDTRTKPDAAPPCGLDAVRAVSEAVAIPVVAIGGVHLGNARAVIEAGAACLCAISATVRSPDVEAEIRRFLELFAAAGHPPGAGR
jgi:thiamine-phosphate pyrophosphorylase